MNFQVGDCTGPHSGLLAFALRCSPLRGLHVGWGSPGAEHLRVSSCHVFSEIFPLGG